jgi:thioredoxin reductase (NADPH)
MYDSIIIGSGPAGLTAGVYLSRFKRKTLVIEGEMPGGQMSMTLLVENWPGEIKIGGIELVEKMRKHTKNCGCEILGDVVTKVELSKQPFKIYTRSGKKFETKSVIIATGSNPRKLGCYGEDKYWGKGVNVCAACDAPLYEGKDVIVAGGGNSAIAESFAILKFAKTVTMIQISNKITANDPLKDIVLSHPKVKVLCDKKIVKIEGDENKVKSVIIENTSGEKKQEKIMVAGVFVAIGATPNSEVFKNQLKTDEYGYLERTKGCKTNIEGVFAAGDVCKGAFKQAVVAAGEGCEAALLCEKFLN